MKWIKTKKRYNNVNETQVSGLRVISDRSSVAEQRISGHHEVNAKRRWIEDFNYALMEYYFSSNPVGDRGRPIKGFRQRTHHIWKERSLLDLNE